MNFLSIVFFGAIQSAAITNKAVLERRAVIDCEGPLGLSVLGSKGLLGTGLLGVKNCNRASTKVNAQGPQTEE